MAREDDIRKIVEGGRARGLGDDQIRALVARYDERIAEQVQQQPTPSAPAGGMLPTAGAFGGSLLGTIGGLPGRIVGAGVGGGLGKAAELFMDEKDDSLMDSAKQVGQSVVGQAGLELAGGALGKGLKAIGPRIYQSVAKPLKSLRQEFPTVVQDAINAGVSVGERGAQKAERLVDAAHTKTRDKLALMSRAGSKPVTMRPVLKDLRRVEDKINTQPLRAADQQTLRGIRDQALAENPGPIPLLRAQELKQGAQRVASEGYRKLDRGADVNSIPLDANMAIASGLRKAIERRVPAVGPLNEETQRLIGVQRMVDQAIGRIGNNQPIGMNALIASGLGGGVGLASSDASAGAGTGLAVLALTNPALASRMAIGANRIAPVASHTPQAARVAALLAALGEPDQ